jgi:tartrate dehydratase alpha subunit/fumarate hydratase class I-like protein
MTHWQPPKREPPETKAELREMLTKAVRNTQSEAKRRPRKAADNLNTRFVNAKAAEVSLDSLCRCVVFA